MGGPISVEDPRRRRLGSGLVRWRNDSGPTRPRCSGSAGRSRAGEPRQLRRACQHNQWSIVVTGQPLRAGEVVGGGSTLDGCLSAALVATRRQPPASRTFYRWTLIGRPASLPMPTPAQPAAESRLCHSCAIVVLVDAGELAALRDGLRDIAVEDGWTAEAALVIADLVIRRWRISDRSGAAGRRARRPKARARRRVGTVRRASAAP
jgi:hypothetical protein